MIDIYPFRFPGDFDTYLPPAKLVCIHLVLDKLLKTYIDNACVKLANTGKGRNPVAESKCENNVGELHIEREINTAYARLARTRICIALLCEDSYPEWVNTELEKAHHTYDIYIRKIQTLPFEKA